MDTTARLSEGQKVLVNNPTKGKLDPQWIVPWVVVRQTNNTIALCLLFVLIILHNQQHYSLVFGKHPSYTLLAMHHTKIRIRGLWKKSMKKKDGIIDWIIKGYVASNKPT